jgi:hypothetical protein
MLVRGSHEVREDICKMIIRHDRSDKESIVDAILVLEKVATHFGYIQPYQKGLRFQMNDTSIIQ